MSYSNLCRRLRCERKLALRRVGSPHGMDAHTGHTCNGPLVTINFIIKKGDNIHNLHDTYCMLNESSVTGGAGQTGIDVSFLFQLINTPSCSYSMEICILLIVYTFVMIVGLSKCYLTGDPPVRSGHLLSCPCRAPRILSNRRSTCPVGPPIRLHL